jgi:hypothetical protein
MGRPTVDKMSPGQLKLHFAAKCKYHHCDGVRALAHAGRVSPDYLRAALLDYEAAERRGDLDGQEDALVRVVDEATKTN